MRKPACSSLAVCAAVAVLAACAMPASAAGARRPAGPGVIGYLTEYLTNKLDRFDPATDRMLPPVTVGRAPGAMAIAPGGKVAYVASTYSTVWAVNLAAGTARKVTGVGAYPYGVAFAADGATAYVVTRRALVVIDAATRRVVKRLPLAGNSLESDLLQAAPRGHLLFVLGLQSNVVTEVSTATNSVVGQLSMNVCGPGVFSPGGQRLYLEGEAGIAAVSTVTGSATAPVLPASCDNPLVAPDGNALYVASEDIHCRDKVTRVNVTPAGLSAAWTVVVATRCSGISIALSPDGSTVFAAQARRKVIIPLSAATGQAGTPVPDHITAQQLTIAGSGRYLFAWRSNPAAVAVINAATRRFVRIVRLGNGFIRLVVVPGGRQVLALLTPTGTGSTVHGWLVPISAVTGKAGRAIACHGQPVMMYFAR